MTSLVRLVPGLLLVASCFAPGPDDDQQINTFGPGTTAPATTVGTMGDTGMDTGDGATGDAESGGSGSTGSSPSPVCGNGEVEGAEACDDGNLDDDDDCLSTCVAASCGDGYVQGGVEECDDANADDTDACPTNCLTATCGDGFVLADVEECDDGNAIDTDACLPTCIAAICGDGIVQAGVEGCDDANPIHTDDCLNTCQPATCGDMVVHSGVEDCDDGNAIAGDGCGPMCLAECANPGGGSLTAENGTNMAVMYCYDPGDSTQVRAQKACESHFGVGNCCVITGGYQDQQYGQCGADGGAGSLHWHWDNHPAGHCDPLYVIGDVVSPGWCGVILGSFID
jgi:cysteine-rich repeat protein